MKIVLNMEALTFYTKLYELSQLLKIAKTASKKIGVFF